MPHSVNFFLALVLAVGACGSAVADSPGVQAGAKAFSGTVSEWAVPTPRYARDPAVDRDGNVYFAVRGGDKIARFDPRLQRFHEWALPEGSRPQGLVVTPEGKVIFGGAGLGELDRSIHRHGQAIQASSQGWRSGLLPGMGPG